MIVVTAPTGQIGRQVLGRLLAEGEHVRVIVRDAARLPAGARERVEVVEGSHRDLDVVTKAFAGADAVFWLVPPNPRAESVEAAYLDFSRPACEAFTAQGVARVVGVSALGRGTAMAGKAGHVTATLALDDLIASTGVAYRALALPSFMDNLLRQAETIRDRGVFTAPVSGDLRAPTCSTGDIAAVAAELLRDDTWTGVEEVPVLGPEDLSHDDMARIMSEVLGRPVRFQRVPDEDFRARLVGFGMTEAVAQSMLDMMRAKEAGLDNGVSRASGGGSPTGFRQWCQEVLSPAVLA
ncbi:NAD(P)H-binding protein [Streptosporangium sp. NPDC020072]|uniref:NmrA family NAD(P)-binding protein n=1 Tax=Streptosporangium sp. NPDC020072 TaxID=3154788 RepID=UPI003422C3D7